MAWEEREWVGATSLLLLLLLLLLSPCSCRYLAHLCMCTHSRPYTCCCSHHCWLYCRRRSPLLPLRHCCHIYYTCSALLCMYSPFPQRRSHCSRHRLLHCCHRTLRSPSSVRRRRWQSRHWVMHYYRYSPFPQRRSHCSRHSLSYSHRRSLPSLPLFHSHTSGRYLGRRYHMSIRFPPYTRLSIHRHSYYCYRRILRERL